MDINLTGTWKNQGPDGGVYKMLQVGNTLFWRGENTYARWTNVGHGTVDEQNRHLSVNWADPDGANLGNHGIMFFEIRDEKNLRKVAGFGGGDFVRVK